MVFGSRQFDFNKHQRDDALILSIKKGFKNFELIDAGRNNTVAFSRDGKYRHTIGDLDQPKELLHYYQVNKNIKKRDNATIYGNQEHRPIYCYAKFNKEIYVSANGDVSPCCWTGFYPRTNSRMLGNDQLLDLLVKNTSNNAIEVGLEKSIGWFNSIEKSWSIREVKNGRLHICNSTCGNTLDDKPPESMY